MTSSTYSGCNQYEPTDGMSRRRFLHRFGCGFGAIALNSLVRAEGTIPGAGSGLPHFAARAKRVIFLFQSGGPSQLDLFDFKPLLNEMHGQQLPSEVRQGQRLTGMSANQSSIPLAGSPFRFTQHGQTDAWVSELLPHTAKIVDDLCFVRSMYTEAINHGPAVTFVQTGSQLPGRPSIGAWLNYGLGSENENLPAFVVMLTKDKGGQPLAERLWGSGFLPSEYQGVRFRSGKDPILYLNNPAGISSTNRRRMLDATQQLHAIQREQRFDPDLETRIAQYELAFRMQSSIPEATDFATEPEYVFREYGEDSRKPGTYAANCLLARRLAERGVRFIQLYHPGWDQHGGLPGGLRTQCQETDQATAALVQDLKRRGLLEDTLVIWGGEFGRTNYSQGKLTPEGFGRDHHPRCFTIWMTGGGIRSGMTYGSTDDFGYNVTENPVHIHDVQATILHLLGIDHEQLTFRYQGRRFRLTDVSGQVVRPLLA